MTMLKVLILSDGVPGHVSQARGLVDWLSTRYELVCVEQTVALRVRSLSRLLLPYVLRINRAGPHIGTVFYDSGMLGSETTRPDLIVSAGGNTSFLNVALARKWSVPNIFLGSGRRLHSSEFSAHLTLEPTGQSHNIVMDLVPTATNPSEPAENGGALRDRLQLKNRQPLYSLVVGGDGAGYSFDETTWSQIGGLVEGLSRRDNCRWLVTTSRRTGCAGEQLLKKALPVSLLADSVWWSESPRKVMNSYLDASDAVFVTADSMTMISEAIASQKPTTVLKPADGKPPERYHKALERFELAGYCKLWTLGAAMPSLPANANIDNHARDLLLSRLEQQIPSLLRHSLASSAR